MYKMKNRQHLAWTLCVSHFLLASLVSLPVSAEEDSRTGAIQLPHTKAETDAIVAALSGENPKVVLSTLKNAKGIFRRDFQKAIVACLSHKSEAVRAAAFEFVLPCEITSEYPRLAKRLDKQFPGVIDRSHFHEPLTDLYVPVSSVLSQFSMLGAAAIPVLTEKLKSDNSEHRIIAISLLGNTGSPQAAPALKGMLSDRDPAVRRQAVRALGHIGGKAVLNSLHALRDQADPLLVQSVAVALSRHQDDRALAIWQALLKSDKRGFSAYGAVEWIPRFNHQKAIPILIDALGHSRELTRERCRRALKKLTMRDFGEDLSLWKKWWSAAGGKEMYEILGEALETEKNNGILMAIIKEGDTRAIPYVLRTYGRIRQVDTFCNERVDSGWALRILSTHSLAPQQDHSGPPYKDDAGRLDAWKKWLAENKAAIPSRTPLIAPFRPLKTIAEVPISQNAEHVAVDGGLMFVGTRGALDVFDISRIAKPVRIGRYRVTAQGVEQIAATRGRLFLTAHAGCLYVYRYSQEGDLEHVSSHTDVQYGSHFMMRGQRLLVSNHVYSRKPRAFLYDISPKGVPHLLDTCDGRDLRQFSFSDEDGFFTTADWSGARIDTGKACPLRTIQKKVWPGGTALCDNGRFYCITHGLLIVRDLATGKLLGTAPARAPYDAKLVVRGNRAYAVLESMGIVIYDVSDPGNIKVLSHTPLPGQPRDKTYRGLHVGDKHIICANYQGQLFIFELPKQLRPPVPKKGEH